jgi:hypothetical protein
VGLAADPIPMECRTGTCCPVSTAASASSEASVKRVALYVRSPLPEHMASDFLWRSIRANILASVDIVVQKVITKFPMGIVVLQERLIVRHFSIE